MFSMFSAGSRVVRGGLASSATFSAGFLGLLRRLVDRRVELLLLARGLQVGRHIDGSQPGDLAGRLLALVRRHALDAGTELEPRLLGSVERAQAIL